MFNSNRRESNLNEQYEDLHFLESLMQKQEQDQKQEQELSKMEAMYDIRRKVLTHDKMIENTGYISNDKSLCFILWKYWRDWSLLTAFVNMVPILHWLRKYSIQQYLLGDIISGFTVAIMHIPHGMAYGLLAGVSPANGLFMAIFPTIVYMIFGTSRHISIGTFAVASMMTLAVVQTHASEEFIDGISYNFSSNNEISAIITPLEVVTSLAFTVGILHMIMWLLQLGTLSVLFSEPFVSGFTTGAAVHVAASQLKDIFGIRVARYKGALKVIYTIVDVCNGLLHTNIVSLAFSFCIIGFVSISNGMLKPCLRKYSRFPLPTELMAVIGGTFVSMLFNVHNDYGVQLVGEIPTGLPLPQLPRFDLMAKIWVDAITVAITTYSIVISLCLTFGRKYSYEVRANQELLALGLSNMVGACFACLPVASSLSRSLIQEQSGGSTQLVSMVSAILIIIVLYGAGPFFQHLPRCVLAGIIVVALKPLFLQTKHVKKFAKRSKLEMFIWLCTFFAVVIVDIDIGLLVGISMSLLALYIEGIRPYYCLLGCTSEASAVYVDINHHHNAIEVPETKIFRYTGSLNFATAQSYRKALYKLLYLAGLCNNGGSYGNDDLKTTLSALPKSTENAAKMTTANGNVSNNIQQSSFRFVILDFSTMAHVDSTGCDTLTEIIKDFKKRDIRIFIASTADNVYDALVHNAALGGGPFDIFSTLHDAVEYVEVARIA